jgi:quercetin dioxygenase-like cupin family protein
MTDSPQPESHRRPHTPPMAGQFLEFDLSAEVHQLHSELAWSTGHNARTLVQYEDFRLVLTALRANARIPEHKTDGRISLHVLSGHIHLKAAGRTFNLRAGGLVALDRGVLHHVEAMEDSAFLLTIARPRANVAGEQQDPSAGSA